MPDVPRKADAAAIRARWETLKKESWLAKPWWPDYLYHFAELRNTAAILESGELRCRDEASIVVDTASPIVLAKTEERWRKYVRLYFRPRTPTQHQVEGFRPAGNYGTMGKHCPMPFVFMFDAVDVLTRQRTEFSVGNLGAHADVGDSAEFYAAIPFEHVFHEGPMPPEAKSTIRFHRCAEALVPSRLDFSALKYVWCRSPAEKETLLNCLSPAARKKYQQRIGLGAQVNVHFRFWTFVEEVTLGPQQMVFRFNPSTQTPGPFRIYVQIESAQGPSHWKSDDYQAKDVLRINLATFPKPASYAVKLTLDGDLAYHGKFNLAESGLVGTRGV
jgi:hypothetical protein